MRGSRTCVAALGLALLIPTSAGAQDQVVVDPDSPTAKQYAIPLDSARRQADPKDGKLAPPGTQRSAADTTLFGEGITPGQSSGAQSPQGGSGRKSKSHRNDATSKRATPGGGSDGSESDSPVRAAISNPGAPGGGIGSTLLIAGGGVLVLLIGALAGVVLRRRSTD